MKLVDYLVRRKRYKELRRQLKTALYDLGINSQIYGIYKNDIGLKQSCIKKNVELKKKTIMLEEELREIFKE